MDRNLEEYKDDFINFGAFGYKPHMMSNISEIPKLEIEKDFEKKGPLYKWYEKGRSMYKYKTDVKLFELSLGGDLSAMKLLDERRKPKR